MIELLTRYYIHFHFDEYQYKEKLSWYCILGYGVTAFDLADALKILSEVHFKDASLPTVRSVIENVKMSDLDQNHVAPNVTVLPFKRGIWYPGGFEFI